MKIKTYIEKIENIKENSDNPRTITGENFTKLVRSIDESPEILELQPLIIDKDNICLAGNQRLKALKILNIDKIKVIKVTEISKEERDNIILKTNFVYGKFEEELLKSKFDIHNIMRIAPNDISNMLQKARENVQKQLQYQPKGKPPFMIYPMFDERLITFF